MLESSLRNKRRASKTKDKYAKCPSAALTGRVQKDINEACHEDCYATFENLKKTKKINHSDTIDYYACQDNGMFEADDCLFQLNGSQKKRFLCLKN